MEFNDPFSWILSISGIFITLGVVTFAIGAVQLITSAGNEEKAFLAKRTMKRAIIGIAIIVLSLALSRLLLSFFIL